MSSTAHSDALTVQGTKGKGPGRSLSSRKTFKPGDLIATFTSPILVLPNGPSAKIVCNHCLAHNVPTKACTGCKAVVYCGAECQKANWGLIHKLECKVFKRVKASADQDWLPTPVRALVQVLLRWDGDEDLRAAFGRLEGNVDRFRSREDVWKDVGLQAYGGMAYAGRKETDNELHMARDILCKVSRAQFSVEAPGTHADLKYRFKQMLSTGPMWIPGRLEYFSIRLWPWSITPVYQTRQSALQEGRQF